MKNFKRLLQALADAGHFVTTGGVSPVVVISFSVVIVVFPPGVAIVVCCFVDDLVASEPPTMLIAVRLKSRAVALNCFIFDSFVDNSGDREMVDVVNAVSGACLITKRC